MKPDKKQTPQLIVLGLLVILCIGYVTFTVAKPPETEMTPPVVKIDKPVNAATAMQVRSRPLANIESYPNLSSPIARRDPFTVQRVNGAQEPPAEAQSTVVNKPAQAAAAPPASERVLPVIPFGGFRSSSGGEVVAVPSQPAEPAEPEIVLTGVICGDENVAIIVVDSKRYVVKQGQFVGGRYKVLSVSSDGVVLADKDRRIRVKLGGVPNAS